MSRSFFREIPDPWPKNATKGSGIRWAPAVLATLPAATVANSLETLVSHPSSQRTAVHLPRRPKCKGPASHDPRCSKRSQNVWEGRLEIVGCIILVGPTNFSHLSKGLFAAWFGCSLADPRKKNCQDSSFETLDLNLQDMGWEIVWNLRSFKGWKSWNMATLTTLWLCLSSFPRISSYLFKLEQGCVGK